MGDIQIITYTESLASEFERLNRAWIEKFFIVEATDLEIFRNPRESIIDPGGQIYFAKIDGMIVGTCAAQKLSATGWELAKLGVDDRYQRKGIGQLLCRYVINYCWDHGALKIIIETNRALKPALSLYDKLGFSPFIPEAASPFVRADMFLELRAMQK